MPLNAFAEVGDALVSGLRRLSPALTTAVAMLSHSNPGAGAKLSITTCLDPPVTGR